MKNGKFNLLERRRETSQRFRRRFQPKKKPVTLIIGIVCRDGIVLAAESQTTMPTSAKLLGTDKIHIIEFEHDKVLVAEAGSDNLSNYAIELFEKKAKGVKIDNDSIVLNLAKESVLEVVRDLLKVFDPNSTAPPDQIQEFLYRPDNSFELTIAYFFDGRPHLYVLRSALAAIPDRTRKHYKTSGIGADLANYILKKHTKPEMDYQFASVIAVKALQDVSNHVEGCGLPMRIASLHHVESEINVSDEAIMAFLTQPDARSQTAVRTFSPKEIDRLAKIISKVEWNTGESQNREIEAALRLATQKYMASLIKKGERLFSKSKQ